MVYESTDKNSQIPLQTSTRRGKDLRRMMRIHLITMVPEPQPPTAGSGGVHPGASQPPATPRTSAAAEPCASRRALHATWPSQVRLPRFLAADTPSPHHMHCTTDTQPSHTSATPHHLLPAASTNLNNGVSSCGIIQMPHTPHTSRARTFMHSPPPLPPTRQPHTHPPAAPPQVPSPSSTRACRRCRPSRPASLHRTAARGPALHAAAAKSP
jgi:hypothetical protein